MTFDTENEFYVKEAKDMVNIVHRLIADGKYTNQAVLKRTGNIAAGQVCLSIEPPLLSAAVCLC